MGKIILWILAALLGLCLLYVLFLTVCALLVDTKKEYEHDSPFYRRLLYGATACCIRLLHIHIHVDGMEKERNLAFVSKAENFRIPIFGRIIRRCCFMAIDRENPRNALLTIEKAAKLIASDEVSIGIYPEGTRSKECVLLPFHNGVFKIAQKASVPIVVASIQGTEQIHKNWYRRRSDVQFRIIETIPTEFVSANRTSAIGERVHNELSAALKET